MGNYSINVWDGSEIELAWSKKSSLYFENNFPICLLSGILNTLIFKVHDVFTLSKFLRNENLLKYFPKHLLLGLVIFEYISYPIYFLLLPTSFIYIKSFFFTIIMLLLILLMMRVIFSFLLKLNSHHSYRFISPLQQKRKHQHSASHKLLQC